MKVEYLHRVVNLLHTSLIFKYITNNTNLTLTLKLNSELFTFNPNEKQIISLLPGKYSYRASAPVVIPNIGTENMESNMNYSWQFYIITKRR